LSPRRFRPPSVLSSELEFAEDCAGNYEISIPLSTVMRVEFLKLGAQAWREDKTVILGDLGIIRGNCGQNMQRGSWNSLDTWMTSDIPTEVRWRSINWGVLKLVQP